MRTRHWKQLVRISSGTGLVDNETLKMLTFGQLLDLNLQCNTLFFYQLFAPAIEQRFKIFFFFKVHFDEVKVIVQKAVKDLSLEQTLKTYEEIWLSKVFSMKLFKCYRSESDHKNLDEEVSFFFMKI
jgi:dynein heavy chain